ncbi:N-acyl homoserine lactonase family protein [Cryobacterium sp. N19]|uniref:N-acyl homoserine lactonase family protein n=1 Tax=Cryobacterium sp. N19 TaxID=2048288 RepID=UPI0018EE11C9|nr:N-acyl homoserine lactonase family protein [Cryobacterium sp. N19]
MSESYEVIVVRHGTRLTKRSDVYLNHQVYDESDGPHRVDYFFWIIRNADRTVIVDTGFSGEAAERRERTVLVSPAAAYAALGIDTNHPHQVVITHAHYDHMGNLGLFPNSPVLMAESEVRFWNSPVSTKRLITHFTDAADVAALGEVRHQNRLSTFTGSTEIAPGIEVIEVGGHTPGQSMVRVTTSEGVVLLTSDALHFWEELERDMPFVSCTDLLGVYSGFQTLRDMLDRGEVDIVVPGHDSTSLDGFAPLTGPLENNAAVIGRIG